jgi:outer membrane protein OmpA-like peptidoglycan-associated protein
MPRRIQQEHNDGLNIFQASTDLMSNAFMIISFLLLISLLQSISIAKKLESSKPIIINEKAGNFNFPSGSAVLKSDLKKYIETDILPEIQKKNEQGNIDFIQVIGYTDEIPINGNSNLDGKGKLASAASSDGNITTLTAGSNVDLGLMRAVAVVQFLNTKSLNKVKFRAYSAGQLYPPEKSDGSIDLEAKDDTKRRIEIRFIPHGLVVQKSPERRVVSREQ